MRDKSAVGDNSLEKEDFYVIRPGFRNRLNRKSIDAGRGQQCLCFLRHFLFYITYLVCSKILNWRLGRKYHHLQTRSQSVWWPAKPQISRSAEMLVALSQSSCTTLKSLVAKPNMEHFSRRAKPTSLRPSQYHQLTAVWNLTLLFGCFCGKCSKFWRYRMINMKIALLGSAPIHRWS